MNGNLMWGRVLAAFIGLYHLCVGATLIASGETSIRLAKSIAGWTIEGSPAMGIIGEIFGCYTIAFGLMMLLAAWNPLGGKHFLTVGVVLIALRSFQRLWFAGKVMDAFQVPSGRHWMAFTIVTVMGVLLLLFRLHVGAVLRRTA